MAKWLIVYSSVTGNTKQIAEAIYNSFDTGEADIYSITESDKFSLDDYDYIAVGYWLTRGAPDKLTQKLLLQLHDKIVILFQTHTAYVGSEHAMTAFARAGSYLSRDNYILGTFSSQGRLSPELMARKRNIDAKDPHAPSPESKKRWEDAAKHPNEEDFKRAKEFTTEMKDKLALREKYWARLKNKQG